MTAAIFSFSRRRAHEVPLAPKMPWQNQDLAELYRVRDRLCAAGLPVEVEGGVSDEGDPWFVYQQVGTDTVVVHICRIDTEIHVINCITGNSYTGTSFREVSDRMLENAPLALGADIRRSSNVVLHPSAFLTAFVAAAIMLVDLVENGRADAAETDHDGDLPGLHAASQDGEHSAVASSHDQGEHASVPRAGGEDDEGGVVQRRIQLLKEMAGSLSGGPGSGAHASTLSEIPMASLSAGLFAAELMRAFVQDRESVHAGEGFAAEIDSFIAALTRSDEPMCQSDAAPSAAPGQDTVEMADASAATRDDGAAAAFHPVADKAEVAGPIYRTRLEAMNDSDGDHILDQAKAGNHAAMVEPNAAPAPAAIEPVPARSGQGAPQAPEEQAPQQVSRSGPSETTTGSASPATGTGTTSDTVSLGNKAETTGSTTADPSKAPSNPAFDINWMIGQITQSKLVGGEKTGFEISRGSNGTSDTLADPSTDESDGDSTVIRLQPETGSDGDRGEGSSGLVLSGGTGEAGSQMRVEPDTDHPLAPSSDADDSIGVTRWTAPDALVAGRTDSVNVEEAGADLVIKGFVLGEDRVAFASDDLAASYGRHVWQDGDDLMMGDAGTGMIRLVGVLADPGLVHHEGAGAIAA